MKHLLLLPALFCTLLLPAQITLTQADAMQAGDIYVQGNTSSTAPPFTVGNAGPSQTWNFTAAISEYDDTLQVSAASWLPVWRTAPFPQCQIAVHALHDTSYYDFGRVDAMGLYVDGVSTHDAQYGVLSRQFQNPLSFIEWPSTYNTIDVDTAYSDFTYPAAGPFDSIREIYEYYVTLTVDAWGTVTTSMGTFPALRIKRDLVFNGQQAYHDPNLGWQPFFPFSTSDRQYEWWTNGIGYPIARMTVYAPTDSITSYEIMKSMTTSISVVNAQEFSVYPIRQQKCFSSVQSRNRNGRSLISTATC